MRGGPVIKHLDDVPMEEMLRFKLRDGSTASIWEKWIEMSPDYTAFWNRWDPGAMTPSHGHRGNHVNFILKGEIRCGDIVCGPGTHIMLDHGDYFGPWVAGPDGCELYGFTAGEGSPFTGDAAAWNACLDEHGAEQIPLPAPKRIPAWKRERLLKGEVTGWTSD